MQCVLQTSLAPCDIMGMAPAQAYVRFASTDDAQRAVALDCAIFSERFGQRYVHVYALAAADAADLQATALASAEFEASLQVHKWLACHARALRSEARGMTKE